VSRQLTLLCLTILLTTGCIEVPAVDSAPAGRATLAAAGDVACRRGARRSRNVCRMDDTARLVEEANPRAVLVLGDAQYPRGTLQEFEASYRHSWGRFRSITFPVPGNHEYLTPGAAGYFAYFGDRAGSLERSWYAFTLDGWRLYALDSNCAEVGGCEAGSPQYRWLSSELAADDTPCSLAFWHHARFSSGPHGNSEAMSDIWELLDSHGVDVALAGHDHHYERFAPMAADGALDSNGMRQFVVGTGGSRHYPVWRRSPGSEAAHSGAFGILLLHLHPDSYSWRFLSAEGSSYSDTGTSACR
jgi:hypothetical protein